MYRYTLRNQMRVSTSDWADWSPKCYIHDLYYIIVML